MKKVKGFAYETAVFSVAVVIWGIVGLLHLFDHRKKKKALEVSGDEKDS